MAAIAVPQLRTAVTRNDLSLAAEQVAQAVRHARTLAQTEGGLPWGVHIDDATQTITVYQGVNLAQRQGIDALLHYAASITVEGDADCTGGPDDSFTEVMFAPLTGLANNSGCFVLHAQETDDWRYIPLSEGALSLGSGSTVIVNDPIDQCTDARDNDGDSLTDLLDPCCSDGGTEGDCDPECSDGNDNDSDDATDYPADFSCSSPLDPDEDLPEALCQNGKDDDDDGLTDYGNDAGCSGKQDNDERLEDGAPADLRLDLTLPASHGRHLTNALTLTATLTVVGAGDVVNPVVRITLPNSVGFRTLGSCRRSNGMIFACTIPQDPVNGARTVSSGTPKHIELDLIAPPLPFRCADASIPFTATATADTPDPDLSNNTDTANTNITCPAQCSDGIDNDDTEDSLADLDDPGCTGANDDNESDTDITECNDGFDNDKDGLADYDSDDDGNAGPDRDPGCANPSDPIELDELPPQCADRVNNDMDSTIDYDLDLNGVHEPPPLQDDDPGCSSASDDTELNAECNDGEDNGDPEDALVDLADPGCTDANDNSENDTDCDDVTDVLTNIYTIISGGDDNLTLNQNESAAYCEAGDAVLSGAGTAPSCF